MLRIFPLRQQRRQLLSLLRSVQRLTQAQPNCLTCRICEENGCEQAILYLEEWDSEVQFRRHISSEMYRRILAAVELSRIRPEISFHWISASMGIELIEELRSPAL